MKLLNKITGAYLYFMFVLFILLIDKTGYHNILSFKWNIYVYTTVIYILLILLIVAFKIFNHSIDIKEFKFSKIQIFALLYLFIIVLSYLFSPYKSYNLLIGSSRMEGLIVNSIYVISFIVVSLTYNFNKRIIYFILLPSIFMGILIVFQRFCYNPLNIYKDLASNIYYGTIGNIDTVGLLYTMYLILGISIYIFTDNMINKFYTVLSIILSLIVMVIINVLSMYLTLLIMMALLFPFVILISKYLKRYLNITILILFICLYKYYNYYYFILLFILMIVVILLLIRKTDYSILNKKNIAKCFMGLLLFIMVITIAVYLINFKSGMLYEVHNILHGNLDDSYGTYRLFLWKRSIYMIDPKYLLIGTGPDTYYISFMNKYLNELIRNGYVNINDTASNFYLTRLINIGILGLGSFIAFIISVIELIKRNKSIISICIFITIISYLIQGMFNLEVVIVTPIFYLLLAIYVSMGKLE